MKKKNLSPSPQNSSFPPYEVEELEVNWEVEKEMVEEKRDSQAPPSPGSSPDTLESFREKMFCGGGCGGWAVGACVA